MNNILVWNVNHNIDFEISTNHGIHWFESAEIIKDITREAEVRASTKKKIVLVSWWRYNSPLKDLSWADLIICFTTEIIHTNWLEFYQFTTNYFNNKNIIFSVGGKMISDIVPENIVLTHNLSFLNLVSMANNQSPVDTLTHRPFIFDALFGQTRVSRVALFNKLKKLNLLDKSLVNLEIGSSSDQHLTLTYRSPELDLLEDPIIKEFRDKTQGDLEKSSTTTGVDKFYRGTPSKVWASQIVPMEIYRNSWFSIVSETLTNRFEFITEKTTKCFYGKRIFLCFSAPGHLALLRKYGFKTFDTIIDESYDSEFDHYKRINLLGDQIKFLSEADPIDLYKKAESILDHNFDLINDISWNLIRTKNFIKPHLDRLK